PELRERYRWALPNASGVAFSADGASLWAASQSSGLFRFSMPIEGDTTSSAANVLPNCRVTGLSLGRASSQVAFAYDGSVAVCDGKTGTPTWKQDGVTGSYFVALSPDGRYLANGHGVAIGCKYGIERVKQQFGNTACRPEALHAYFSAPMDTGLPSALALT